MSLLRKKESGTFQPCSGQARQTSIKISGLISGVVNKSDGMVMVER